MNDMLLLLTIVSVIALWAFLTQLVAGLLLVFKSLEAIDGTLAAVAFGVRAIEQETEPLARVSEELPPVATNMTEALRELARAAAPPAKG